MESIETIIAKRKSVRTFDGNPLTSEDRVALANMLEKKGNPFGVPVEFRVFDAEKHGLKSPALCVRSASFITQAVRSCSISPRL